MSSFSLGFSFGGQLNSSFKKTTDVAKKELGIIGRTLNKVKNTTVSSKSFSQMTNGLQKSNREAKRLNKEMLRLKKLGRINLKLDAVSKQLKDAKGEALGLLATGYSLVKVYGSAARVLKAQGDIATLGITEKGIKSITKAGQEMSLKFGQISAPQFIKASYDIKSGIASLSESGVKEFTKMAGVTAIATKSSVDEMTKLYALGYGIFRKDFSNDMDFGKKFSGAIATSVQMFRTDGADLSNGLSNLGGSATALGVSMSEQLAIIGTAKETYSSASEASTGYKALLNSVGKAQEKLGLNFTDAQGQMLPLADILDMLKNKYGDMDLSENVELMEAMGGAEATKFISSMIDKTDSLRASQVSLNKAMEGGLSKSQEMAQAADRGQGLEKLGNAFAYIGYTIGKVLEPAFNLLAAGVGGLAKGIAWLDETFPRLVPLVFGSVAAFGTLYIVTKTLKLAKLALSFANLSLGKSYLQTTAKVSLFSRASKVAAAGQYFLGTSIALLGASLKRLSLSFSLSKAKLIAFSAASKFAAASQWALNMALNANPIGLVVAGVAALAAGAVYLYKNFEPFTNFIDTAWAKLKSFFSFIMEGWKVVGGVLSKVGTFFGFGEEESKESSNTELKQPKRKLGSKIATGVVATQLATTPLPSHQTVDTTRFETLAIQEKKQTDKPQVTQHITMHITIQNPANDLDIERAISKAVSKQTSLNDEEI